MIITQTEHQSVTIELDEDGKIGIKQTFIEGTRMPSVTIWLTKQEFAKIIEKWARFQAAIARAKKAK